MAGIIIHFLSLLIITELLLWNKYSTVGPPYSTKRSTVGYVLFEPVKVSGGVKIYA